MAARKSRARKVAAKKPEEVDDPKAEPKFNVAPDDKRPAVWKHALEGFARGLAIQHVPRDMRIHLDDRFTGKARQAQVNALVKIMGMEPEEAAQRVLDAAMAEHRGDDHCNW